MKIWKKIKKLKKPILIIVTIFIILAVLIPYIVMYFMMRRKKRQIIIHPEFKVVNVKNRDEVDPNVLGSAIRIATEISKKINK